MRNKYIGVFFLAIVFLLPQFSFAATLSLSPSSSNVNVGNIVSIRVVVNTEGVAVNNGEAIIQYPTDLLEVISISKSSSIFSLWVEEPTFSNGSGRISFNGGAANPGFNGTNGTAASITFRAKKAGTASVIFGDSAVRKNDGLGTNVLSSRNPATIVIGATAPAPTPEVAPSPSSLAKPVVTSNTHPDQGIWYKDNTASFNWKIPSGVTSLQAILNKTANATPSINYDSSVTQKTLSDLSDGVYYFHLRYINKDGMSPVAHYQVNIDATAPLAFIPTIRKYEGENLITLDAEDATSGISYYTLKIDDGKTITVKKSELVDGEYKLPVVNAGTHEVTATAHDKAGNNVSGSVSFSSSNISIPTVSLNSKDITKGDSVIISGTTDYPNSKVEVTMELGGKVLRKYEEKTLQDGTFSFATDKIKSTGTINIWAENVFDENVRSEPSSKVYLKVNEPEIVKVTFALFWLIILMILLVILLFITYEGWHKFFGLRRKIDKELEKTASETHKAMTLFKEELNNQLEVLENVKADRALNKKEQVIFKELQKNVDTIDEFISKKLKKM